jgi:hypothetical protein
MVGWPIKGITNIVGKTIAAIDMGSYEDHNGNAMNVIRITFTDGSTFAFSAVDNAWNEGTDIELNELIVDTDGALQYHDGEHVHGEWTEPLESVRGIVNRGFSWRSGSR